ncbi:serine hydrolase [Uliginosibacterium sp. sgz301328]|uniref:serine hydrolase n=1 Tax=Uliginosibacterium sp. sgz301328 TaxID=3243764 RepID=UPI00359FC504
MRFGQIFALVLSLMFIAGMANPVHAASSSRSKNTEKTVKAKPSSKKVTASKAVSKKATTKSRAVAPAKKVTAKKVVSRVEEQFDRDGNPLLRSAAFMVQEIDSGRVLLEKNANSSLPIASISKLMTAMVVLDAHLDLNEQMQVSEDDVDRLKNTSSHLPVGTVLSRDDMLRLALMASENRAASALSRYYPGGHGAFIAAMNEKARVLGLKETRFEDSIGLNKNNVSSARDLAIIVANAARYPLIREFTTTAEHTVSLNGRPRVFHNTNVLVRQANNDWQIGLSKTGFINESGRCLVMQAWFSNKPVAIVLLDSNGSYTRIGDANRIRKWVETALGSQSHVATLSLGGDASN